MENETGVGSIPITFRFAADHVLIHGPIELLEYLLVFYYVILETKPQGFFYNPTWKMKLVSVRIDPERIGWPRYGADTIPLSR